MRYRARFNPSPSASRLYFGGFQPSLFGRRPYLNWFHPIVSDLLKWEWEAIYIVKYWIHFTTEFILRREFIYEREFTFNREFTFTVWIHFEPEWYNHSPEPDQSSNKAQDGKNANSSLQWVHKNTFPRIMKVFFKFHKSKFWSGSGIPDSQALPYLNLKLYLHSFYIFFSLN